MNHHGLFIKLMGKSIPIYLLRTFECWFSKGVTCVRWGSTYSRYFRLTCGIRQGGVLSPYFFASYIDDIVDKVNKHYNLGCYIKGFCVSILLYADDIIIIAPTVMALQKLFNIVETELAQLDMKINANKSHCIRIGPRYNFNCADIVTSDGDTIQWTDEIRYLGIFITSDIVFSCSHSNAKKSFYRTFNGIFGKVGRIASEDVIIQLVKTKCMPAMLYGLDVCTVNKSQINSLQYAVTGMLMKVFQTKSRNIIQECAMYFNFFIC
jgi:Reverse transcriptase (RNA-dependent DNA polymerase)